MEKADDFYSFGAPLDVMYDREYKLNETGVHIAFKFGTKSRRETCYIGQLPSLANSNGQVVCIPFVEQCRVGAFALPSINID